MGHVRRLLEQYESYVSDREGDEDATIEVAGVFIHPDDTIIKSILLATAKQYRMRIHGITLSRGEATSKNYRSHEGFDPKLGDRAHEAAAEARSLGFASHTQLEYPDAQPARDLPEMAHAVAGILAERNIDLVFSTTKMSAQDSRDHMAAGMVAFMAAEQATKGFGQHMGVLVTQPGRRGNFAAEGSADSLDIVRKVAMANSSQFRVGPIADRPNDWYALTDKFSIHPDDWRELEEHQYPLEGTATYTYAKCGQLLVPQLIAA